MKSRSEADPLPTLDGKFACITLDLEDDWYLDDPQYDHLTFEYIDDYIDLVSSLEIPVSVFVVGKTIEKYPDDVSQLQRGITADFHLHSYHHDLSKSYDFEEEIKQGVAAFESFFGQEPIGYRAPQGNITDQEIRALDRAGFQFDSSIFPSYRPGVYNNLDAPVHPYRPPGIENLIEYPIGAIWNLRIPFSQSYLKLFGRPYLWALSRIELPEVLVFDSHLQDFYKTASHDQIGTPIRQIHKRNLANSVDLFKQTVHILRDRGYKFVTLTDLHSRLEAT